ncbi:hypothetical protein DFR72_10641 [Lentzea flaviverrucosa]|uniref:Uncharacterized protein n=1 Tax=Lentzea flaviverrucosa TaxID=200379 RepID=A0A1H9V4I5_9PSEU|nr:hypothetical protein DFR72_10641 [Lentzea flaviverrucosa]SES16304.1 hypothetical protein SAMN05216195_109304 [Lentzea flaviverrucosa]
MLVIAAVAGCSSPPPPASPPVSSSPATDKSAVLAWIDQICAADKPILTVSAVVATGPKFSPERQPTEADRPAVIAYVTKLRDMYAQAKTAYDGVGPSPVPRGDELVAGHRKGLGEIVPKLQQYLDNVQRFPAQGIDAPAVLAGVEVMSWLPEGPGLGDLRDAEPALDAAYKQAANCTS